MHTPTQPIGLTEKLQKDPDAVLLKDVLNTLANHEGQLKSDLNRGVDKDTFDQKQNMINGIQLATRFLRAYWSRYN